MANIWDQTIAIDEHLAKRLIEDQQLLQVDAIQLLGQGFDNVAYLVNNQYVFRFPRRQEGVAMMHHEITVLPRLAQQLSFPCSYPKFIDHATEEYPSSFAGYVMLQGRSICDMPVPVIDNFDCAVMLATWLQELHSVPVQEQDRALIFESFNWKYDFQGRLGRAEQRMMQYTHYFQDLDFSVDQLTSVLQKLKIKAPSLHNLQRTVYCHGDLHSKHILVDADYQLQGLIDWGDVHIGHPGIDIFVAYLILSDDALQLFLKTYQHVTEEMQLVALMQLVCQAIAVIAYCSDTRTEEHLKKSAIFGLKRAMKIVENM